MGAGALALAAREHDLDRVAELYVAAFEQAAGGASVDDAVLREVSEAAAAVGIAPGSPEAGRSPRGWPRSTSVADALRAVPAWAWLAAIVLVSFAFRAWLVRGMLAPFIMTRRAHLLRAGQSFADGDRFAIRELSTQRLRHPLPAADLARPTGSSTP